MVLFSALVLSDDWRLCVLLIGKLGGDMQSVFGQFNAVFMGVCDLFRDLCVLTFFYHSLWHFLQ